MFITITFSCIFLLVSASSHGFSHRNARRTLRSDVFSTKCSIELSDEALIVDGEAWLTPTQRYCVRTNGEEVCETDSVPSSYRTGTDALGHFEEKFSTYDLFEVAARKYDSDPRTLLFTQTFLETINGTDIPAASAAEAASNGVSSWFPSFEIPSRASNVDSDRPPLGIFELSGMFIGADGYQISAIHDLKESNPLESGPVAIFSEECVVVMSPASAFMTTSSFYRKDIQQLGFGVMGSIKSIPDNHRTSIILSAYPSKGNGPDGIRQAFSRWGSKLQKLHNTQRLRDVTLDYLQYSTDNGAYYYYHTEENKDYESTIFDLKEYTEEVGLPFRSWLADSWWYFQGNDSGVKEWIARPDVFPDGMKGVHDTTNWMIMAHNRFWSSETVYAKQNGGDFDFILEKYGLPLEETFWDYLFGEAKKWGLDVYEQDWLNVQSQSMNLTLQNIGAARRWLMQMGKAAKRRGIPIQYCMAWPRHLLQSLEIDAVTQIRASDDVTPNSGNSISLGVTSMFAHALGVTPHKDSFWSTPSDQPGNPYQDYEEASVLLSIIATYSTGPVAPSDKKEFLNVGLIMKSCSADGTILKPDVPAVRNDATFLADAWLPTTSFQRNQTWSTRTSLSGFTWTYTLSAGAPSFHFSREDFYPSDSATLGRITWNLNTMTGNTIMMLSDQSVVPASNRTHPQLVVAAPLFPNRWAFIGEGTTKWTSVSRQRFSNLEILQAGFKIDVIGSADEIVEMIIVDPQKQVHHKTCKLGKTGYSVFDTASMSCKEVENALHDAKLQEES